MQTKQQPAIVAWIIWISILQGLFIIQWFAGGGFPTGVDTSEPPAILRFAPALPALLALIVRFLVIPRLQRVEAQLPAMVVGLALAEGTGIVSMFLVDDAYGKTQLIHLILSVLAILMMAPVFIGKKREASPYLR